MDGRTSLDHGRRRIAVVAAIVVASLCATLAAESSAAERSQPLAIVFALDTTSSMTEQARAVAKGAIADALYRRAIRPPHGEISFYARQINRRSGTDQAAAFHDAIPAISPKPDDCDLFDPTCLQPWANKHNAALKKARAVKTRIERWSYRVTSNGSEIRGAIAAAARNLAIDSGERWLVLATDLRPANTRTQIRQVRLDGIHVDVIVACKDAFSKCRSREEAWGAELRRDGAASVAFLPLQQASQVLSR